MAMTPRQEAEYALAYGQREDCTSDETRAEYDRLKADPVSRVYPGSSWRQYCSQVHALAMAVWEPTAQQVIRIDPAWMPG